MIVSDQEVFVKIRKNVFRNKRNQQFYVGVGVARDFKNPKEITLAIFRPQGQPRNLYLSPVSEFERDFDPVKAHFERRR